MGAHAYNLETAQCDPSGGSWYGTDGDSDIFMFNITGGSRIDGTNVFYNTSGSAWAGATPFYLGPNSSHASIGKTTVVNKPLDYHGVTGPTGPYDTGQSTWTTGVQEVGSSTLDASSQNYKHDGQTNTLSEKQSPEISATNLLNQSSPVKQWCAKEWNRKCLSGCLCGGAVFS